ncbi:MAG: GAF domain-containing protein [Ignavibacteriaceae bacterium]|nr:GAF domain-containing protein [Ignavibacteriaceae bacterium]
MTIPGSDTNFRFSDILYYIVLPILIGLIFFVEDTVFKISAIVLAVVYSGFIINNFLNRRKHTRFEVDEKVVQEVMSPTLNEETMAEPKAPRPLSEVDEGFSVLNRNAKHFGDIIDESNILIAGSVRTPIRPPDLKKKYEEIANEEYPEHVRENEQFPFVLEKILSVIKDAYEAHTAIFFFYNRKEKMLAIKKYVSNSKDILDIKYDLLGGILTKIVTDGEPELLSEIVPSSETDNIIYYKAPQKIKCFVGVPVFHKNNLIGILAIDSLVQDRYGIEHIYSLGKYVRLITILISLFEEKYTESTAKRRLSGFVNFIDPMLSYNYEADIVNSIERIVHNFIEFNAFSLVYYQPVQKKFFTLKVVNKISTLEYIPENFEVELKDTLVGKCINAGIPLKLSDTSNNQFKRFGKKENVKYDGSFLAVPLIFNNMTFGVLCFDHVKKGVYSPDDVNFLRGASNLLAFSIYYLSTTVLIKSFISIDTVTKLLNKKTFRERAVDDHVRVLTLKIPAALALIKIDDHQNDETLFDVNPGSKIVETVADVLREEINPFITVGITDENEFGVFIFNMTSSDAQIWADKLRLKIARTPVPLVSKQITTTVSIGVASANKPKFEEVFNNARQALYNAVKNGGNKVRNVN